MVNMTSRPCVFLLTASGSCHPIAVPPAFITCRTARHVTSRASRRVTGLINLLWQLPDARPGCSPPSLSRSHIPVSPGPITRMIYRRENGERWGTALEVRAFFSVYFSDNLLHTCALTHSQLISFSFSQTIRCKTPSLSLSGCSAEW